VEAAPLIDVVLGPAAQHVVVEPGPELLDYLQNESHRFAGRVGFLWLDSQTESPLPLRVDLEGQPGVLGRADRFVQTDPRYAPLATKLLGHTWIVEKLTHAVHLARSVGNGVRFITLAGELLEADGALVIGPRHASTGLISRRSELRALKTQLAKLEVDIQQMQSGQIELDQQIANRCERVRVLATEHQQALETLGEHQHKITAAEERRTQLDRQRSVLESELAAATGQHAEASKSLADTRAKQEQLESELADTEVQLAVIGQKLDQLETQRRSANRRATEVKVELAKSEERLRNLHTRMRQLEENQQERRRTISETQEQLSRSSERARQSRWNILRAESEIAELYLRKETFAVETVGLIDQREALGQQRTELTTEAQSVRVKVRKFEENVHAKQLAASEVEHQRSSLASRLREDYGIELAKLEDNLSDEEQRRREEVEEEISQLRRKINNLGNVNLEALSELNELESRHEKLSTQHADLADAKVKLERIIDKINADSRRLFAETLHTVRGHFQTLFRDLFGGGRADIVLDEDVDVLESGIEIVARPPGKEPRSISLLSGGEKTLTCVALLLAIFRSRPSPFCLLDEVDAALDEANIDRFIKVLKDFLAWTQFIIVTHSKKTMTCANTIYGVTMQESGVSKQVSVRFEDVSEDGEIRQAAEPPEGDASEAASDDEPQAA